MTDSLLAAIAALAPHAPEAAVIDQDPAHLQSAAIQTRELAIRAAHPGTAEHLRPRPHSSDTHSVHAARARSQNYGPAANSKREGPQGHHKQQHQQHNLQQPQQRAEGRGAGAHNHNTTNAHTHPANARGRLQGHGQYPGH